MPADAGALGLDLGGTVALVTGSGSGIGAAIAERLAAQGAAVAVADLSAAAASRTAEAIRDAGGVARGVEADVSSREGRGAAVAAASALGRVGILVNNAAFHGERRPFLDDAPEEWDRVIATNLTAPAALARALAPGMIGSGGGAIVNLTAIQSELPAPSYSSYIASKGGLLALTRALAVELSPHGVRVNAVSPGVIATGSTAEALATAAGHAGQGASAPRAGSAALLGRLGSAAEVAAVVGFLVSPAASFVTGTCVVVDGGRVLSRAPDALSALGDPGGALRGPPAALGGGGLADSA